MQSYFRWQWFEAEEGFWHNGAVATSKSFSLFHFKRIIFIFPLFPRLIWPISRRDSTKEKSILFPTRQYHFLFFCDYIHTNSGTDSLMIFFCCWLKNYFHTLMDTPWHFNLLSSWRRVLKHTLCSHCNLTKAVLEFSVDLILTLVGTNEQYSQAPIETICSISPW